ncbi:hypothetical protein [Halocatena halophila]|uniref:hypothetical protein n=1 Tax=Halocatena halophila TaxID=2814576 RepID=UPI002ED33DD0
MATGRTHTQVSTVLDGLRETYDSFSINQSSVTVDHETFERVAERATTHVVDVDVKVQRESSVLVVESDGMVRAPHGTVTVEESGLESGAHRLVENQTGIDCHVVDVLSATILTITDKSRTGRDPVYRLSVLFEAIYEGGEPEGTARWQSGAATSTVAHPALD